MSTATLTPPAAAHPAALTPDQRATLERIAHAAAEDWVLHALEAGYPPDARGARHYAEALLGERLRVVSELGDAQRPLGHSS